jgi:hypothetical protein
MQENPLQQLRDVHLPLEPDWWPPAPGWWIVAICCTAALIYSGLFLWRAHKQRRPIRAANALLEDLLREHKLERLDALGYIHGANEILKRLLVVAFGVRHLAAASDEDWLFALDRITGSTDFSHGQGKILGSARFAPSASANIDALHKCIENVIANTHPNRTPRLFFESFDD